MALYSGRYRPAWRMSQIGGTDSRLPAKTRSRGVVASLSVTLLS
jgi:hypothetical protein